jgi:hypothetical protein
VTDEEFLALLVARTTGRITQVFGVHLSASSNWGLICSEILSTFLPLRIREGFLSKYVLDRFQSATEELSKFVMFAVVAADILAYEVPESVLVHRMVQNIHPNMRSRFIFASCILERHAPVVNLQKGKCDFSHVSMAVGETRRSVSVP